MNYRNWKSPLGRLHLAADDQGLRALAFDENWETIRASLPKPLDGSDHPLFTLAVRELEEYFAGHLKEFTVPLAAFGTPFQSAAWSALRKIAYGKTASYREQALRMKNPKAVRAVGRANARNPIGIIVPCHRVIGSNGSLTGYAGGLERKKALLALESGASCER